MTALFELGFFDFFGRFVQYLKHHNAYEEPDGLLLKIVGPEVQPPDLNTIPEVKWRIAASVWAQIGSGPVVDAGFSTTREYELDHASLPLPPAGQTATWKVQVQYRYKNQPFGQKSQWVEIPVRGT